MSRQFGFCPLMAGRGTPGSGEKKDSAVHCVVMTAQLTGLAASRNQRRVVLVFLHQPGLIRNPLRQPVGVKFTFHDWPVSPSLGIGKSATKGHQKRQKSEPFFFLLSLSPQSWGQWRTDRKRAGRWMDRWTDGQVSGWSWGRDVWPERQRNTAWWGSMRLLQSLFRRVFRRQEQAGLESGRSRGPSSPHHPLPFQRTFTRGGKPHTSRH